MLQRTFAFILCLLCCSSAWAEAPYVNSQAIKERFDKITKKDMDLIRSKNILFASRSFGLNLRGGLMQLSKKNPQYDILGRYQRFDVFKAGGDVSVIPKDIFETKNFVHFLATYWPHSKRLDEVSTLLSEAPHEFGKTVDVVVIYYHTAMGKLFDTYASKMDAMAAKYPNIKFIYVCAGYMAASQKKSNDQTLIFNTAIRKRYQGKVPLYDLGAILSDDGRCPQIFCPEYSSDPAGVHPNLEAGQTMMAKGFLLMLKEALSHDGASSKSNKLIIPEDSTETLKPDHPEYIAVRAILDANGLTKKTVESVAVIEDQHVVGLYLQEGGVTKITDDIAKLRRLRLLHLYGDRNLEHPLLTEISPKIAKCTRIEELLLNSNDLSTLPKEISKLKKISKLSLADNKLKDLPSTAQRWAEKYDPEGLKLQKP